MMRALSVVGGIALVAIFVQPCDSAPEQVSFVDLIEHAKDYANKEVVVTAGYRVGFEWQILWCPAKSSDPNSPGSQAWVQFAPDLIGGKKFGRSVKAFDALYKVKVRGVLETGLTYGHLGGWEQQFRISELLTAKRLWTQSRLHREPSASTISNLCQE